MSGEKTSGEIITFYSYKGGTGRSMALANIACLLAARQTEGNEVLMVDWDLEAPGLHWFFESKSDKRLGLIDLFLHLDQKVPKNVASAGIEAEEQAKQLLTEIVLEDYIAETAVPHLRLLKAGRFDKDYSTQVNTFDWAGLYGRSPYLYRVLAQWLAERYRYVLIDSRTGLTDLSGICTTLMPEKLVVVFTPNQQSLSGVSDLVRRATTYRRKSDDLRPLLVYPLPSRIDSERDELRKRWRYGHPEPAIEGYQPLFEGVFKEAYGLRECSLEEYFNEVQIQHCPDYAYGEEIAVNVETREDRFSIARSYRAFLDWLEHSYAPWERLEQARATRDLEALERQEAELRPRAKTDFEVRHTLVSLQQRILEMRRKLQGEDHPATLTAMCNLAQTLKAQGDPEAWRLQEQVLEASRHVLGEANPATLAAMGNLAQTLKAQGDLRGARRLQEQVLEVSRRILGEAHCDTLKAMANLAQTLKEMGDSTAATVLQEQLVATVQRSQKNHHAQAFR
jgi:cellulose biosynthesis protein BcsQ